MTFVFYTSAHGFGHASRDIAVIHAIRERDPGVRIVMRSGVPRWFVDTVIELQPAETDTGVVQIDSLRLDIEESARRAAHFYADFPRRTNDEASALRHLRASVVVGDIPPLAFAAARAAGVPSVALGNFTWDWIYRDYPDFERDAPGVVDIIRRAYAETTLALRLPFHGGFEPMARAIRDIPLVARRARAGRDTTRSRLALDDNRPIVLASFGGHVLRLPFLEIVQDGRFTLLVTDHEAGPRPESLNHLRLVTSSWLDAQGLQYADLVAASDVVVTKPGYGIVSECVANGAALLYTSRGHFAEHDVFLAEMPGALRCRYLPQEDLLAGRWADAVDALLAQPQVTPPFGLNGAAVAAEAILDLGAQSPA